MLKGTQRRMIVVRTPESPLFDSAYFVIRTDIPEAKPRDEGEMVREANRIIEEATDKAKVTVRKKLKKLLMLMPAFAVGSALGALVVGIVWIVSFFA